MKKTMKAILAAMLAAVMALGSLTAFAAEEKENLKWDYYGWDYFYDYAGEIVLGENVISSPEDSYYCYFVFNAENEGFYRFGYLDDNDCWLILPGYCENGVAYDEAEYYINPDEDEYLYYLGKGENIIAFDSCEELKNSAFTVDYYGEKAESLTAAYDLVRDHNIHVEEETVTIYAELECGFDSGETFDIWYVSGITDCDGTEDVVSFTAEVLGCEIETSVNLYNISDIIENIEVTNIEEYLYVEEFYNEYDVFYPYGETVTITYKNGEKQSVVYEEAYCLFNLPDGNEVYLDFFLSVEEKDDAKMCLVIANENVKYYNCEMEKASVNENFASVKNDCSMALNDASYYFRRALIKILECDSIYEFIDYGASVSASYFVESFACAASVFSIFFDFIRFYLG